MVIEAESNFINQHKSAINQHLTDGDFLKNFEPSGADGFKGRFTRNLWLLPFKHGDFPHFKPNLGILVPLER